MTTTEYLKEVLKLQELPEDGPELEALEDHRADVEKLLLETFSESNPTIAYGGSKAKGTLVKESYDLDLICYFPNGENGAGATLKEIYANVAKILQKSYVTELKNSSIRLHNLDTKAANRDFHVDVVPGRYSDDTATECYINQNDSDKDRLKTNLTVHIEHVKNSGVIPAIRLLKLWKVRKQIRLKQFVWELLVIKLLTDIKKSSPEDQLRHVLETIRDSDEPIHVEDPANPSGNDLSKVIDDIWPVLRSHAEATMRTVDSSGWESVFGSVQKTASSSSRATALTQAASTAAVRTSPWSD
jgi:hypothetical protein